MGAHQNNKSSRSGKSSNKINNEIIDRDAIKEDMKSSSQTLLDEETSNKRFDPIQVKQWANNITNGLQALLKRKYPQYAFCICVYISEISAYVSNDRTVLYKESDIVYWVVNQTDTLYSQVNVFAYKIRPPMKNFDFNRYDTEFVNNINKLLDSHLKGKTFEFEAFKIIVDDVCEEINKLLLARYNKPCSNHVAFINELPMGGTYFDFKVFDVEYFPIFFNYSNNSLNCRVYLFLINF